MRESAPYVLRVDGWGIRRRLALTRLKTRQQKRGLMRKAKAKTSRSTLRKEKMPLDPGFFYTKEATK